MPTSWVQSKVLAKKVFFTTYLPGTRYYSVVHAESVLDKLLELDQVLTGALTVPPTMTCVDISCVTVDSIQSVYGFVHPQLKTGPHFTAGYMHESWSI